MKGGYPYTLKKLPWTYKHGPLTLPERKVAALIGLGCDGDEIQDRLHISRQTRKIYQSNIIFKLGIRYRGQIPTVFLREYGPED